ncbi:TspO/MBR family protein [Nakamurella sp. GG22]
MDTVSKNTAQTRHHQTDVEAGTGRQWLVLVGLLAASFAVAFVGGLSSTSGVDGWYSAAEKPPWTPPNWVFGPVWTFLYTAMAVAAWLVWRRWGWQRARPALLLYAAQLVLNAMWTPLFFGAEQLWLGLAVIVALDVVLALTVVAFFRLHRLAGALMVPYLLWALYATSLNAGVAALN